MGTFICEDLSCPSATADSAGAYAHLPSDINVTGFAGDVLL